jgi:uncharacterized protein YdiU (UPF0061 family)
MISNKFKEDTAAQNIILEEKIKFLERQVNDLNSELEQKNKVLSAYSSESDDLINALRDEAERRSWCEDYNDFAYKFNENHSYIKLDVLEFEYTVTVRLDRTISTTVDIIVTAGCEDDAHTTVDDGYTMEDLLELANETSDFDDWEVDDESSTVVKVRAVR